MINLCGKSCDAFYENIMLNYFLIKNMFIWYRKFVGNSYVLELLILSLLILGIVRVFLLCSLVKVNYLLFWI